MNYGSYNKYSRSQFHRYNINPLLPKTENGEYMTYDQYAYERDKQLKEYYTDFFLNYKSIFNYIKALIIWQREYSML